MWYGACVWQDKIGCLTTDVEWASSRQKKNRHLCKNCLIPLNKWRNAEITARMIQHASRHKKSTRPDVSPPAADILTEDKIRWQRQSQFQCRLTISERLLYNAAYFFLQYIKLPKSDLGSPFLRCIIFCPANRLYKSILYRLILHELIEWIRSKDLCMNTNSKYIS